MYQQCDSIEEPIGFIAQKGIDKLLIYGRYVDPKKEDLVKRADMFASDLVIDSEVGMTPNEFRMWMLAAQSCKSRCCELKMIMDEVCARGDRILVEPGTIPGVDDSYFVSKVECVNVTAKFPLNGYYLVDPKIQKECARAKKGVSFPVYYQGIAQSSTLLHTILRVPAAHKDGNGKDATFYMDPTWQQVRPTRKLGEAYDNVLYMGSSLDSDYLMGDQQTPYEITGTGRFTLDNMPKVMQYMFPPNMPTNLWQTVDQKKAHLENNAFRLALCCASVISAAYDTEISQVLEQCKLE